MEQVIRSLESTNPQTMICLRDSAKRLLRSYTLSRQELERLAAEGLNPLTVAEETLAERATYFCQYDTVERMTSTMYVYRAENVTTYSYTRDGESVTTVSVT